MIFYRKSPELTKNAHQVILNINDNVSTNKRDVFICDSY